MGWTLADLKTMTTRERRYWLAHIAWEENRINVMKDANPNG